MYRILCKVSGGVTGTRYGHYKFNGEVQYFDTKEKAQQVADNLSKTANGPHKTPHFSYISERS